MNFYYIFLRKYVSFDEITEAEYINLILVNFKQENPQRAICPLMAAELMAAPPLQEGNPHAT